MRHLKIVIVLLLLMAVVFLLYDDTVDNRGTASPFDPAELTDLDGSHEQVVLAVLILTAVVILVSLSYIRKHPFRTLGWIVTIWLIVVALAIVAGLARWPPCFCP